MVRFLPPLCWTGLIAYLGGSQWSGDDTASWLGPLLGALLPTASPEALAVAHFLIRKAAHVIEYAVLAALWRRGLRGAWVPLGLAVMTASLDELRQSFAPGRVASMADVLLDGAAAATALGLLALRTRLRRAAS
jgi:VanZ family protein